MGLRNKLAAAAAMRGGMRQFSPRLVAELLPGCDAVAVGF